MRIGNDRDKTGGHHLSLLSHVRFAAEPAKTPKVFAALLAVVVTLRKTWICSVGINIRKR